MRNPYYVRKGGATVSDNNSNVIPSYNKSRAWLVAIICILCAIIFSAGRIKVAPTMPYLLEEFGIGTSSGSWLMTVTTIMGAIMAIPGGFILIRFGARRVYIAALGIAFAATMVGTFTTSYPLLLVTRFLEGAGLCFTTVCLPAIISAWFPKAKLGLPMAIFSCFIGLGSFLIERTASPIIAAFGYTWHSVWSFSAILYLVGFVLFVAFVHMPKGDDVVVEPDDDDAVLDEEMTAGEAFLAAIKNTRAVMTMFLIALFSMAGGNILVYGTTFMHYEFGFEIAHANIYTSSMNLVMIVSGLAMGVLLNRFKNRWRWLLLISCFLSMFAYTLEFLFTAETVVLYVIFGGLILQMAPACIFTMSAAASNSVKVTSAVMALFTVFENVGAGVGPVVVGNIVETPTGYSWVSATPYLFIVGCLALVCAIVYFVADKRAEEARRASGQSQ